MTSDAKIKAILDATNKAYRKPPALKKTGAVDELIRTVLSQNTSDANSLKAFAVLKDNFKAWDGLLSTETRRIAALIRHAGLANIKAKRIKEILGEIKKREGKISLSSLGKMAAGDALSYLRSLKGVGPKTAACVLLFSFGRPIMPVDTHIFRVTKRLGLIADNLNIEEAHGLLSRIVPKGLIYNFHLGIIEHGRRVCKAHNPRCGACVLYKWCKYRGG